MRVGTCVASSGEGVAGEEQRFVGGEGAISGAECGYEQFGEDGVQGVGCGFDGLLQVLFGLCTGLGVEEGEESCYCAGGWC